MAARVIKAGEPFNFAVFSFQDPAAMEDRPANLAPVHHSPPPAPQAAVSHAANSAVEKTEKAEKTETATNEDSPRADEVLRAAHAEAAKLVAEAQARAAEIERAARERGRAEAQAMAQTELNQAVKDLRAQLTTTLDELAGLRPEMAARAEQDLVRLALEIAKKIVHREVKVDHEVALTLARVALGRLHSRISAVVRLHPDDFAYVREHRQRLGTESTVEIIEDRSIGAGGCMIQSEMGEIDARIEQQFAEIEKDFLSV